MVWTGLRHICEELGHFSLLKFQIQFFSFFFGAVVGSFREGEARMMEQLVNFIIRPPRFELICVLLGFSFDGFVCSLIYRNLFLLILFCIYLFLIFNFPIKLCFFLILLTPVSKSQKCFPFHYDLKFKQSGILGWYWRILFPNRSFKMEKLYWLGLPNWCLFFICIWSLEILIYDCLSDYE